jgi:hypothetical protein
MGQQTTDRDDTAAPWPLLADEPAAHPRRRLDPARALAGVAASACFTCVNQVGLSTGAR